MKKLLFLPLLVAFILAAAAIWFYISILPVTGGKNFSNFVIAKGLSASQIGTKLESAGIIKSALAFKIYIQFTGQSGKLQSGQFRLSPSFSMFQNVNALFNGPIEIWVTIPEGLRREEMAAKFATALGKDATFSDDFLLASKGKEGYLFPDTYLFPLDTSATAVVKKMADTFTAKTLGLIPQGSNLTFSEAVTLASIIERETKTDAERPVVAGILLNRINAGMPLQVDAAVQYAVGTSKDWWPILSLADLKINSAYNTYKYAGLPPAAIANPGLSSLKAAFNPAKTDYLYYIHDSTGLIHYAKTLAQHNANIARYLGK
ncbi:MAG: endolytic transglycosylase MltG [Candidatus Woesebacteria bacterium]|nr:endolytic transglycosylase MltG [Candidatus Woesebacteria bacterium]